MEIARPWVMGILNVTPDSFYSASRTPGNEEIATRVRQLVSQGADIIDIGGYSSRPGADDVTAQEEYARLKRGIEAVNLSEMAQESREAADVLAGVTGHDDHAPDAR